MKFENLISPITLDDFKSLIEIRPEYKVWQTTADVQHLFCWNDLNRVLRQQRLNTTDVAILRSGRKIDSREVTERVRRRFTMVSQLNRRKLLSVLRTGGAIRISRIDEKSQRLEHIAADAEHLLACGVNINLYAGFGPTPALLAHADTHDVLVIQLEGRKFWEVFGFGNDPFPIQHPRESECPAETVWTGELKQSDVLFMPRGSWHRARVTDDTPSLHITIGFNHIMLYSLLDWMKAELSHLPVYREHLLGWKETEDPHVELRIRKALEQTLAHGFLSRFRRDRRETKPERFNINLPSLKG